jgi:hypothetical protein|uniref:Uncharacterized protein n=2 Tax=Picea TaxID=3328 RepID=A0A101M521_PICGL|nr:hypothetical protein ABT39_MTgene1091 [Picea glauca]QHR89976.1 hypothetical protein Q903MT_gene3998 [Picea sitchensis]
MLDQSAIDSDPVSFEPHLPTVNDCHGRVNSGQSLSGVGLDTPDTRPTLSATAASEVCVVVRDHTNVSQVRNRFLIQELMKELLSLSACAKEARRVTSARKGMVRQ